MANVEQDVAILIVELGLEIVYDTTSVVGISIYYYLFIYHYNYNFNNIFLIIIILLLAI